MMSKKCKYAFKALIRLAKNYEKGYFQTGEIARLENIPQKFLEQILLELKHAKFVNSKQGNKGGYYLLKHPNAITVADIYRMFDGPIALLPCISLNFYEPCDDCLDEKKCELRGEFTKIREKTRIIMSKTTLQDFLKKK
ncbi:MAG: Rrf2 family transcriptional regulator [Bacteroidota bacterium]|nr:Rrf2 family transcriptional regulator [Bacteroidota bacterium]